MNDNPFRSTIDRGRGLIRSLTKDTNVELIAADRGFLQVGSHKAEVRLESGESIRVELRPSGPLAALAALEAHGGLSGNVRFAVDSMGPVAIADTQVDGQTHLPRSFRAICEGLLAAIGKASGSAVAPPSEPLSPDVVQGAIDALDWPADSVVRHEDAWELRARLENEVAPVRLEILGAEAVLRRTVLSDLGADSAPLAVAHEALRLNARLRHARLALVEGRLVAESRLHDGQITPPWISLAAYAVACAARLAEPTLSVLVKQPAVREFYASLFSVRPDGVL